MERHEKRRHAASDAVIALRQALGLTQQELAVKLLKSAITTVARYETSNPPRGDVLLRFATIAEKKKLFVLRDVFRRLYLDDVLANLGFNILWDPTTQQGFVLTKFEGLQRYKAAQKF